MKKKWSCLLLAVSSVLCAESENLFNQGDFEKIPPATQEMKEKNIKNQEGSDSIPFLQPGWCAANRSHRMKLIDGGKEKENVHSGKYSLMLESSGHFHSTQQFPCGKYNLRFYVKGNGQFRVQTYLYGKQGNYLGHGNSIVTVTADPNLWKEVSVTADLGTENEKAKNIRLVFACYNQAKVYLDDIVFQKNEGEK